MTETLPFATLESDGRIELRRYPAYLVAEVDVEATDHVEAATKGFRPLADYIFGANAANSTIAMTTPVTAAASGETVAMTSPVTAASGRDGTYTVRFSMPGDWTLDTLPVPTDDRVRLVEVPTHLVLAIRFRGRTDAQRIAAASREILSYAAEASLVAESEPMWAGYSAPYVPVPLRRWELFLRVEPVD